MDTRLLGKPKSFDGSTDSWRLVQVHVLGLRWRSRLETQASQRPASLNTVVSHVDIASGGFSAQHLLEHAGDGEGLLSWRGLVAEYGPAIACEETSCTNLQG